MLSPDQKKGPSLIKKLNLEADKKDKNYIKTTTAEDGDMKKLFMAVGETILTAMVGPKVAARYLRDVTNRNIQKEKVSALLGNIITPDELRRRIHLQEKLSLKERLAQMTRGAGASKADLEADKLAEQEKEEQEKLKAALMQELERDKGK